MPNKRTIIIVAFFLLGGIAVALSLFTSPPLIVTQSSPRPGTTHNPFSPIIISFNRPVEEGSVSFDIDPKTNVSVSASASGSLVITPTALFTPLTAYTLTIHTTPTYILRFETEQAENNTPGWNDLFNASEQLYLQEHSAQDKALAEIRTSAPIVEDGFRVEYSYGTNTYTILLERPYPETKEAFLRWLAQRGVRDSSELRINYINR